jgi:hypothetical protein
MESNEMAVEFLVRITEMQMPKKNRPVDPKKAAMDEKRKKFVPGGGINPKHAPKGGNIKEATYQAGKAGKTGEDGDFVGVAKLSKSKIKGLDKQDARNKSRRRAERNAANQDDAAFRREHGKLSAAERRKANQLMNRPQGMRHKDPQDHYPQS